MNRFLLCGKSTRIHKKITLIKLLKNVSISMDLKFKISRIRLLFVYLGVFVLTHIPLLVAGILSYHGTGSLIDKLVYILVYEFQKFLISLVFHSLFGLLSLFAFNGIFVFGFVIVQSVLLTTGVVNKSKITFGFFLFLSFLNGSLLYLLVLFLR